MPTSPDVVLDHSPLSTGRAPARDARVPSQSRGHKRVDAILDAAEQLIIEVGVEAATVNAIAERAGASIGSLYHFFPNREAIHQALALRIDHQSHDRLFSTITPETLDEPLETLFRRIVTEQVAFASRYAAFAPLYECYLRDPVTGGPFLQLYQVIFDGVRGYLAARLPLLPAAQLAMVTHLSVVVVRQGCQETRVIPPAGHAAWLEEVVTMLVRYFDPLEAKFGRHTPRRKRKTSKK